MLTIYRLKLTTRDLSGKEFNNNDSKGPKSVASFIIKLSELVPRSVLKQMTLLVKLLDSEVYFSSCRDLTISRTLCGVQ
jgi:condensin complex subunit 1